MKRLLPLILAVAALAPALGTAATAPESTGAARNPVAAVSVAPASVRAAQLVLRSYGYGLAVDGVAGPQTARAIMHWQRANGLPPTGIIDAATLDSLNLAPAVAERLAPPAPPPVAEAGLNGLPFAPDGLDLCAEMNFYRVQAGLPDRFSDQPRTPAVAFRDQGWGWRESGCHNDVGNSCCVGYWGLGTGNFTAPGYRDRIRNDCHISVRSDIKGTAPLAKQKQACMAKVLYDVWQAGGSANPWRL